MAGPFEIRSSNPILLRKATRLATDFAQQYMTDAIEGVVFLGAIVRGYFDEAADIDVAVFKKRGADVPFAGQYQHIDGMEIHLHLGEYEDELAVEWSMSKRWAYSEPRIMHDPRGRTAALLAQKVPLKPEERKWLLMSGLSLSEWYINRLSLLWVKRGDITSAHLMFAQGLEHFLDMLFALNGELIPATKWKYYLADRLPRLPDGFHDRVQRASILAEFSEEELARRKTAFMEMWQEMRPVIEAELGMSYAEINDSV